MSEFAPPQAHAPKLSKAKLSPSLKTLVDSAKKNFKEKLSVFALDHHPPAFVACAPGRVNLIGEHTDSTGGLVLPMAIDRHTVIYGTGSLLKGKGSAPTSVGFRAWSDLAKDDVVEERRIFHDSQPPDESEPRNWVTYVAGTIKQYLPDLPPEGYHLELLMTYSSDIPVGCGLSSSASLEVATAVFLECFLHEMSFSSAAPNCIREVERALRCQKAENTWCYKYDGIMDQMVVSQATEGNFILFDCRSLETTQIPMKKGTTDQPLILITNSNVQHEIADSYYGKRRGECHQALEAMMQVPLYHVLTLRDANLQDVETAREKIKDVDESCFKRAKHVVTENIRTAECKMALKLGLWERVGELMNLSHASLRDEFEISCTDIDMLVDVAQQHPGVFGSRLTGGGFGGCTITLVVKEQLQPLIEKLKAEYKSQLDKECDCFVVVPSAGAHVLAIDMDFKKE